MKTIGQSLIAFLVTFVLSGFSHAAAADNPLDSWQAVFRPAAPQGSFRGIAYLNGTFVAAGYSQRAAVSTNGSTWTTVNNQLLPYEGILAVASGDGKFVAVGGPLGAVITSTDGFQWTRRLSLTNVEFWAATYAAGKFVAVGYTNAISAFHAISATSTDGVKWQVFPTQFATTPRNIVHGHGQFVAVGSPISLRSVDGANWEPIPTLLAQGVSFDGSHYLATLDIEGATSSDGVSWTPVSLPQTAARRTDQNYYTSMAGGDMVLAGGANGGSGLVAISKSGAPFTTIPSEASSQMGPIRDAVFVDGSFYLADQSGKIWKSGRVPPASQTTITKITNSEDGIHIGFTGSAGYLHSLEYANQLDASDWQSNAAPSFSETGEGEFVVPHSAQDPAARFFRITTK